MHAIQRHQSDTVKNLLAHSNLDVNVQNDVGYNWYDACIFDFLPTFDVDWKHRNALRIHARYSSYYSWFSFY